MIHNIPQPAFEQFVADELAHDPNVEIRKGVSFVSAAQVRNSSYSNLCSLYAQANSLKNKDEVFTRVEERANGRQYVIRSQHVIACDGGRSAVRKMLEIECEGEDSCMTYSAVFSVLLS